MRIGVLTTSFPREEGDVPGCFVLGFARALAARGHRIEVLAPAPTEARFRVPPHFSGLTVHWVRYLPRPLRRTFYGAGVADNLRRDPLAGLGLAPFTLALAHAARARAQHWDAVVSHWALPCAWVGGRLRGPRQPALPHLAVLHSADVHAIERLPGSSLWARQVACSARALVFVSGDLRQRFLACLSPRQRPFAAARAHVCPMGVDGPAPSWARAERVALRSGPSQLTVLSLGRLVPIKGVDVLIRAVARLGGVTLVIAGDGPERAGLQRLARELGVRARFVGEVRGEAKAAWLRAADLFVLASRRLPSGRTEGMPTSVLEAMAEGLPVVATRAGGVAELIQGGENGLLVEPDDVAGLACAIASLHDPSLRERLARSAHRTARAHTWPELAPRFEAWLTHAGTYAPG